MVVFDTDDELLTIISVADLQADGLFVLGNINSVITENARDFPIDRAEIGNVAGAYGLMDNVEGFIGEDSEFVHGCLNGSHGKSASSAFLLIQFQHGVADIHHGDPGPCSGIKYGLPAATGGKAKDIKACHRIRQPAASIQCFQGIAAFGVCCSFCEEAA